MTIEQIEQAALQRCASKDEMLTDFGASCFIAGAQWRINSVWHDASEAPELKRDFIYQAVRHSGEGFHGMCRLFGDDEWEFRKECCVLERWAYVTDLLPELMEETK